MKLMGFSIFDDKAKVYSPAFFVPNVNLALRAFGDAVLDKSTGISRHASDYHLYKMCEFDDNSGLFSGSKPEFVANAVDFVPPTSEVLNEKDPGK